MKVETKGTLISLACLTVLIGGIVVSIFYLVKGLQG